MLFAVSVTVNSTLTPSRFRLPGTTMPPMRKLRPCGASWAATCEGVKKNTRFFWNAASTSAAAMPSAATPTAIAVMRLCLGFTAFSTTVYQQGHLHPDQEKCHPVGTPHVEPVPAHGKEFSHWFSRIRQRTRTNVTAMLYIQKASAMISMPVSIAAAMLGARVRLTDAPWCSVFHHCTE